MNKTPQGIWKLYESARAYNDSIGTYTTAFENEDFFVGRQWGDLYTTAPGLDKPVVNFLQRVVSYFVSNITTDSIGVRCKFFNMPSEKAKDLERVIRAQLEQVIEDNDLNGSAKDAVRDAAVEGDACYHIYFDADAKSGQAVEGLVKTELISGMDVYFGDRQTHETESQPWIIVASRKPLNEVKELAEQYDLPTDGIEADSADYLSEVQGKDDSDRATLLTCYYREKGTIHRIQATKNAVISPDVDLGYRLYPIAWMPWERQKGCYHGVSCITALKPNQIAINKIYAMALKQQRDLAYPKILYNEQVFPEGWTGKIGAVAVNGDPREAATSLSASADIPGSIFTMANNLLTQSREMMGASDASLGNINPDNTSAIIAVQQATAMPLELKKRQFGQMIEKVVRSMLDIITVTYGWREILVTDDVGNETLALFDWGSLRDELFKLSVDIGDTNYWDPNTQATMLERLLQSGIISEPLLFLEHMPDGLLKDKDRLIAQLRQAQTQIPAMPQGMPVQM